MEKLAVPVEKITDFFSTGTACGACDKYRVCVFGQVTSLQDQWLSLMLFSIKGWEVGIFWSAGKVLVIPFRKYMTSYGLRTLCNDPETPSGKCRWQKVSLIDIRAGYRDAYDLRAYAMRTMHLKIRMAPMVIVTMCLTPPYRTSWSRGPKGL